MHNPLFPTKNLNGRPTIIIKKATGLLNELLERNCGHKIAEHTMGASFSRRFPNRY